jgi:hypothetical protein
VLTIAPRISASSVSRREAVGRKKRFSRRASHKLFAFRFAQTKQTIAKRQRVASASNGGTAGVFSYAVARGEIRDREHSGRQRTKIKSSSIVQSRGGARVKVRAN